MAMKLGFLGAPHGAERLEQGNQCRKELGGSISLISLPSSDCRTKRGTGWIACLVCFCVFALGLSHAQSIEGAGALTMAHNYPEVRAAIDACPQAGCIVYANSPSVNKNLGLIDPGNKTLTLYLGPYTYTVKQIMLRKGMKIIGMGGSDSGTILQSVNDNDPCSLFPK